MKLLICLTGLLLIVEGVPYFVFPERMKKWMLLIQETPDNQLRFIGLLAMCTGLALVYFFRS